jgi:hypothetical protein
MFMQLEPHVKVRQEKFGAVVFETLRERVFVTNETGADILRLVEEINSPQALVDHLTRLYDYSPESIRDEVEEFVASLRDNGILQKEQES